MSWWDHLHVNLDENVNYNEHDYISNGESIFETDTVFSSREELLDWVRKTGYSVGYVAVIKTSKSNESVTLQCDCGGISVSKKKSTKNTGSKKCGCPFELVGKYLPSYNGWMLVVICETHNHKPALYLEGHSYARRLSENESVLVNELTQNNVKPHDILSTIKKQNSENVSTLKTIYNVRNKFRMMGKAEKTDMQGVMSLLEREGYNSYINPNKETNELEDLFFAHPESINIWRAFPHVLLMDATYNTVRYPLPLLEIVGVTPTNMTFCIAFVFMHKEKKHNYEWSLLCLKSLMDGCMFPRVIVTDRELALINAYKSIFPDAKGLLCTWHLNRSILAKCKGLIKSDEGWFNFNQAWNALIYSETEEAYAHNLEQLTETTIYSPGVITYLNQHWLARHKELFVVAWTKEYLHFGNHTTNRVESQHAKLKLYLDSSQSDLKRVVSYIHEVVNSQFTGIKKCGDVEIYEDCRCQLRTSYGLPCSHEQAMYLYAGQPLPLDVVDAFWKKLDLSPCLSSGDYLDCEAELEELNAEFNKQFGLPSTTSVRDPPARKSTHGRPSRRKTYVPPKPSNSSLPKKATHEYINQFPKMFHAFIDRGQDVRADGNCGFRATAVGLGLHEDEWPTIRYRLLQELSMHHQQYVDMFGVDVYHNVRDRLNFFNIGEFAPIIKWISMPEIGILIASQFNVILHTITNSGSQTYLPLRSSPPPQYQHHCISLGYVNNGHYVCIFLKEGYPMPTVATQWFHFKFDCATSWITPYMERINNYTELLNRTFYM